jgi:hypothetical protein
MRFVPQGIAAALLVAVLVKTGAAGSWMRDLKLVLLALLGFVMFVASEEAALFTGRYGWTRDTWREKPAGLVKRAGAAKLVICSAVLLAR